MSEHGSFKDAGARAAVAGLALALWLIAAAPCHAQPFGPTIAPAPIGSPLVPVGPVANPFGPPPMAIGPAPSPRPYVVANPYFGPPLEPLPPRRMSAIPAPVYAVPGPSYAQLQPPPLPYSVRQATPFDAQTESPNSATRPYTTRYPAPPPGAIPSVYQPSMAAAPVVTPPAPIGNLRMTVSERFLNRLIAREEQRPGDIKDFILGAQVTGHQMTNTRLTLDLVPSADKIRGHLVLKGVTHSQTTGVTPQAMIDTASEQQFLATKEIQFDGIGLATRHAVVHVQARNKTLGAVTPLTGTLFGGIADRIAYRAAERKQNEAEAIARDKVVDRVYPEFDSEVDKKLGWANDQLEATVRKGLRLVNLMPSQQQTSSTDYSMTYCAQFGSESSTPSPPRLQCQLGKDDGICLMLHQSLFNAVIPISGLKGMKTTDKQIKAYFAPYEYKPDGEDTDNAKSPISIPGLTNLTTDIEFDENDPLTIEFEPDRTLVTLRAHFKPAGQKMLPPLALKIEYKSELIGDKIVVTPGAAQVSALNSADADSIPSLTLSIVKQGIESNLSRLAFDSALPAALWPFGGTAPKVVAIQSDDGWAAVTVE